MCGKVHGDKCKVGEISLFAHGEALGVTVSSQEDNDLPAESDLRAHLIALMGGRAAEELLFHEVTGGASNDFDKANQIATQMVTRWGMGRDPDATEAGLSGRGPLGFLVNAEDGPGSAQRAWPAEVQAAATRAIRTILDEAYADASATLLAHMTELRRLAAYLVENERVDGETFDALYEGKMEVPTAAAEWRPETSRPRAWAEIAAFAGRRSAARQPVEVTAVTQPKAVVVSGGESRLCSTDGPRRGTEREMRRDGESSSPRQRSEGPRRAEAKNGRRLSGRARGVRRSRRITPPPIPAGVGRPAFGRRLRNLAAGYLHAAESWLLSSGAKEVDRS